MNGNEEKDGRLKCDGCGNPLDPAAVVPMRVEVEPGRYATSRVCAGCWQTAAATLAAARLRR